MQGLYALLPSGSFSLLSCPEKNLGKLSELLFLIKEISDRTVIKNIHIFIALNIRPSWIPPNFSKTQPKSLNFEDNIFSPSIDGSLI